MEITADHDTHAQVPGDAWNKVVGDFMATIKVGHVADGLLAAIESCGALLNTHYPGVGDDPAGRRNSNGTKVIYTL